MKTNHTPGPWSRQYDTETDWSIVSIGKTIAQNNIEEIDTGNISKKENEANAKLIAAAPELLENLKNMLFAFSSSAFSEIEKSAIKCAENVIKKATE